MKRLVSVSFFVILFIGNLYAQGKFYLQSDAGIKWYQSQDFAGDVLSTSVQTNLVYGVRAGYQITDYLSLETGVYSNKFTNNYNTSVNSRLDGSTSFSKGSMEYISVPFQLKCQQGLLNNRVSVNTFFGPELYHSRLYGEYYNSSINSTIDDVDISGSETATRDERNILLFSGGLGLDFKIIPRFWFVSSFSTTLGNKTMNTLNVDWQPESTELASDNLTSKWKGDSYNLKFGLKYYLFE